MPPPGGWSGADKHHGNPTSQAAGMTSTKIPQARWHYLVYGGITAGPAIQVQ